MISMYLIKISIMTVSVPLQNQWQCNVTAPSGINGAVTNLEN